MRITICVGILLTLTLNACTTGSGTALESRQPPVDPQQVLNQPPSQPLSPATRTTADYLCEIDSAPVPAGIDPVLWEQLRAELRNIVANRPEVKPSPMPILTLDLPSRQVSFTPYGADNMVRDLQLSGNGPYLLSWTYRNKGDYDLNGAVNISDLTPIGLHFQKTSADPLWFLCTQADGDNNGEINITDITPIGTNFGGTIVGYRVYGTDDITGDWNYLGEATVDANLHKNAAPLRFVISLPSLEYDYYALWPYDGSEDEGGWSNIVQLTAGEQRRIVGATDHWSTLQ